MSKFDDLFKKYNCDALSEQAVKQDIERILSQNFDANNNVEVYKQCLNLIDLTSLSVPIRIPKSNRWSIK